MKKRVVHRISMSTAELAKLLGFSNANAVIKQTGAEYGSVKRPVVIEVQHPEEEYAP